MQVFLDYPWWVFILGGSFWAALSFAFYRNDRRLQDFGKKLRLLLASLRAGALILIFFLLLNPFLKAIISEVEKPLLAIAFDNSESIKLKTDTNELNRIHNEVLNQITQLSQDYEIDVYRFGDQVDKENNLNYEFKLSNPSNLKKELKTNYTNRNLAGVVILTDGIFNRGANANRLFDDLNVPIYTIGIGDTSIQKDLYITQLRNNQIAYLGNDFLVEASVGADFLSAKNTKIAISKDGEILQSKNISISSNRYFEKHVFTLSATEKGLHKYTVSLSNLSDEVNPNNNSRSFFIDVIDASQRILILADAPHPDVAAIRASLTQNLGNKVEVKLAKNLIDLVKWEEYNLVIFYQIPGKTNPDKWAKQIHSINTPILCVLGNSSDLNFHNSLFGGVKVMGNKGSKQEVFATLNNNFQKFSLSEEFIELLNRFPPVITPFGEYKTSNALQTLLFQKIGPVETQQPLLAFEEVSAKKVGYLTGEGIWRWRILSFRETNSHKAFDDFLQKIVQYLSLKEDKSRFKLNLQNAFFENERLTIDAELYDETYTLTTLGEVSISIKDSAGVEYPFTFYKTENKYILDAGLFSPGNYSYNAKAKLGAEEFNKSGSFTVKPLDLEKNNTRADFNLLTNIAQNTGGGFYSPTNLQALFNDIKSNENAKPVIYNREQFFELINLKWLFFIILFIVCIEWFIRKYKGAY